MTSPWSPACIRRKGWPRRATPTVFVLVLVFTACKSQNESPTTNNNSSDTIISTTPPFQTREPDRYYATRTITIVNAKGETVVTKSSIARDGDMRRTESETASKRVAYLDVPAGRFVLLIDEKVYADLNAGDGIPTTDDEETPERLLHADSGTTTYQRLGTETLDGRSANKYRVVVNSSSTGNVSVNETLIWIDAALNMPIRSESKSPETTITTELTDIALDVDKSVFQIPEGYQKIAFSEFRKRLTETTE